MDLSKRLSLSYYKNIAVINEAHKVYLVQHQDTGKIFVKKILDVYNTAVYEHLKECPVNGIPKIIDFAENDGQMTVIEEYISGQPLSELIETHALTADKIIKFSINLCEIVEQLHKMNPPIIHRDIKPSNILILPYDKIILLDFNAAKQYHDFTPADTVLFGTHGYAAPEQYGFGASSPQTDIYAIGILLKELSCSLNTPTNLFDAIIRHCIPLEPAYRYSSVLELKNDLLSLTDTTKPALKNEKPGSFLPPGYRTKTPWKMALSSVFYLFILCLCVSLQVENMEGAALWVERIFCCAIILSIIFGCFNYRNVQRFIPLCNSQNRLIRYLGIIILDAAFVFSLLTILIVIEGLCFHL